MSISSPATPQELSFAIVLEPEADGSAWNVRVPALPGCFTYGRTRDEALTNAREAIELYLGTLPPGELDTDVPAPEVAHVTVSLP